MKFFSRSFYPSTVPADSGEKTVPEYGLQLDIDGNERLVEIGRMPIYDIIQASAEGASIAHIITRWRAGDDSVLNAASGVYGDFTNLPSDLAESHQLIIKAQNTFNSLPLAVREQFAMNLSNFLHAVSLDPGLLSNPGSAPNHAPSSAPNPQSPTQSPTQSPAQTMVIDGITYQIKDGVS